MRPAIDLRLLVVKAMDWISHHIAERNVGVDAERLVRKVVRKTGIDGASFVELFYGAQQVRGELLVDLFVVRQVDHFRGAGQEVIRLAVSIDLDLGRARGRNAIGVWRESEQIVEARSDLAT